MSWTIWVSPVESQGSSPENQGRRCDGRSRMQCRTNYPQVVLNSRRSRLRNAGSTVWSARHPLCAMKEGEKSGELFPQFRGIMGLKVVIKKIASPTTEWSLLLLNGHQCLPIFPLECSVPRKLLTRIVCFCQGLWFWWCRICTWKRIVALGEGSEEEKQGLGGERNGKGKSHGKT